MPIGTDCRLFLCWMGLLSAGVRSFEVRVDGSPCPEAWDWDEAQNHCYLVSDTPSLSWYQASLHCRRLGSALADASNKRRLAFVRSDLLPEADSASTGFWVGRPKDDNSDKCPFVTVKNPNVNKHDCREGKKGYICGVKATNDCAKKGCQQVCAVKTPKSSHCGCLPGYRMESTGKCVDIDECVQTNRCDQRCINIAGDYKCDCFDGFSNKGDDMCIESKLQMGSHSMDYTSTILTVIATLVPVILIVFFVTLTLRLRLMNERMKEEVRVHEEEDNQFETFGFDQHRQSSFVLGSMDIVPRHSYETSV